MHGNESPKSIRVRLWEETRLMLWVFLYIFLFLAALAAYRAVLLGAKGAPLSAIVQCFIEAMVLAKVMVIGNALRLGDRLRLRRRALRVVLRAATFAIFALLFAGVEELAKGLYHGKSTSEILQELRSIGPELILARAVVLFVFFLPLFLIWEVCRVLGEAKAIVIFFSPKEA